MIKNQQLQKLRILLSNYDNIFLLCILQLGH
jgi:hypothetical protein